MKSQSNTSDRIKETVKNNPNTSEAEENRSVASGGFVVGSFGA